MCWYEGARVGVCSHTFKSKSCNECVCGKVFCLNVSAFLGIFKHVYLFHFLAEEPTGLYNLHFEEFSLQGNSCRTLLCEQPDTRNLMCAHQYTRQNLPLSLVIFVVLDWWVNNGLGCLELEQTVSWKGSFCPRLIPAFQLNVQGQSVKVEHLSILSLTSYCPTCFLLITLLFTDYFRWYIIGFIPLKTFFLSEQLLLLPTRSFEIQLRAGSSGDAYD